MNVLVWDHYPSHLEQENNCYSICTKQISKAVQFIRANYRHKVLEVISTRHILLSFRHRPSALLWIRVLPAWLHNGLLVQPDFWVVQPADTAKWLLYCKDFFVQHTDLRKDGIRRNQEQIANADNRLATGKTKLPGSDSRPQLWVWSAGLCLPVLLRDPF